MLSSLAPYHHIGGLVAKSCLTLCDPMDCSPPGSSVHGILQIRILEWVAISSSRGSPQPRDWTCPLHPLHCRQILYWLSQQGNYHISKCLLTIVPFPSTSESTRHTEKQKHRHKRLNKNQNHLDSLSWEDREVWDTSTPLWLPVSPSPGVRLSLPAKGSLSLPQLLRLTQAFPLIKSLHIKKKKRIRTRVQYYRNVGIIRSGIF